MHSQVLNLCKLTLTSRDNLSLSARKSTCYRHVARAAWLLEGTCSISTKLYWIHLIIRHTFIILRGGVKLFVVIEIERYSSPTRVSLLSTTFYKMVASLSYVPWCVAAWDRLIACGLFPPNSHVSLHLVILRSSGMTFVLLPELCQISLEILRAALMVWIYCFDLLFLWAPNLILLFGWRRTFESLWYQ